MKNLNTYTQETFGHLKGIVVDRQEGLVSAPTILLLHGYGANAKDLVPFSLMSSMRAKWVFLQGPLSLDSIHQGFSWFPFNYENWLYLSEKGDKNLLMNYHPEGIDEVCSEISFSLKDLKIHHSNLIIGGFSQGSYVAVEFLSRIKEKPKSIAIFSGTLMNKESLMKGLISCENVTFFQSHGLYDNVLPFFLAKELEVILRKNKMNGEFEEFSGGHEIPDPIFKKFEKFTQRTFNFQYKK